MKPRIRPLCTICNDHNAHILHIKLMFDRDEMKIFKHQEEICHYCFMKIKRFKKGDLQVLKNRTFNDRVWHDERKKLFPLAHLDYIKRKYEIE